MLSLLQLIYLLNCDFNVYFLFFIFLQKDFILLCLTNKNILLFFLERCFLKKKYLFLLARQSYRERRARSFTHCFTPQMAVTAKAGAVRRQEQGAWMVLTPSWKHHPHGAYCLSSLPATNISGIFVLEIMQLFLFSFVSSGFIFFCLWTLMVIYC